MQAVEDVMETAEEEDEEAEYDSAGSGGTHFFVPFFKSGFRSRIDRIRPDRNVMEFPMIIL